MTKTEQWYETAEPDCGGIYVRPVNGMSILGISPFDSAYRLGASVNLWWLDDLVDVGDDWAGAAEIVAALLQTGVWHDSDDGFTAVLLDRDGLEREWAIIRGEPAELAREM